MLSEFDRECESIGADHAADDDQLEWNSGVEPARPIDDDFYTASSAHRMLRCHEYAIATDVKSLAIASDVAAYAKTAITRAKVDRVPLFESPFHLRITVDSGGGEMFQAAMNSRNSRNPRKPRK